MEMMAIKSEAKRRSIVNHETPEARCAKRRRRDHAAALALDCQNEPTNHQTGQSATRSSKFRGVSRHRWTGRFEAHLWDKLSWNVTQKKKGKQGAYDEEESAARAYDLAALKYWGPTTFTNFPVSNYDKEIEIMQNLTKEEYLASLRRKSSGFSRGVSKYRGVARHHHNGRWEARIGRVFGNKWLNPGTQTPPANNEPQTTTESNVTPSNNYSWFEEAGSPFLEEQKPSETRLPFSPTKRSSPTAVGLLLRSSMFKQLVEKNLHLGDEDEGEDMNTQLMTPCYTSEGSIVFLDSTNADDVQLPEDSDFNYDFQGSTYTIGLCPFVDTS
ncbi:hypothetical protein E3N88_24288 [Mikania micrantha]|uniref:AP2/ERF domain-containing protein n=1 Tax=Mikania micrantha TaxID=192012 RepID=A0A5N6NI05_9ASTR|nr:hypothetical protein E3N88_24288 [Mikania micrantha]